jgi:alkanesulfonate monooxygenase SsuD/methylene tetrahydromethanopterin reductase-like flavin-dependent oxidoreductase (luciferase family)
VELIAEADAAGIDAVWLQAGGVSADPLTLFAAAATRSTRVQLGTAIIPTWPRHPLALAQQALVVESLAPGRLVLGVGPSTPGAMRAFGVDFHHPLAHVR